MSMIKGSTGGCLLAVSLLGCASEEEAAQACVGACVQLMECGLAIPHPFECESKCANAWSVYGLVGFSPAITSFLSCVDDVEGATSTEGYCGDSVCARRLACVESSFATETFTFTDLELIAGFRGPSTTPPSFAPEGPVYLVCDPELTAVSGVTIDDGRAVSLCEELKGTVVELAVERVNGYEILMTGPCAATIAMPDAAHKLSAAGHWQISARLSLADGNCNKLYGSTVDVQLTSEVVPTPQRGHVLVSPDYPVIPCEVCDSGQDEDLDGLFDCGDPECAAVCGGD